MKSTVFIATILGLFVLYAFAQTCNIGKNYGNVGIPAIYNPDCTNSSYPYCTGNGLCSECSNGKACAQCDCPSNYRCVQPHFNEVRFAAFCSPYPEGLYGRTCSVDGDCDVKMLNQQTNVLEKAYQSYCVSGVCRFCNRLLPSHNGVICKAGEATNVINLCEFGSKANTGRACGLPDVWNSNVWPLASALPTNSQAYECSQWCVNGSPAPSGSPTSSLTVGASPSSTPKVATNGAAVLSLCVTPIIATVVLMCMLL